MVTSYEEFTRKCEEKHCPRRTIYNSKTCARDTKRQRCFKKYERKQEQQKDPFEADEEWERIRKEVAERDDYECRLAKIVTLEETELAANAGFPIFKGMAGSDTAHVIRRSQSKKLYYNPDNLVLLSRTVHGRLDTYKCPLTGRLSDRGTIDTWWIRIIGQELWDYLHTIK